MPKLNPTLFEPLKRIENAVDRVAGVMLTAPNLSPRENELVAKEIQEIRNALEAFKTAVEAGEMTGFKDRGIRGRMRGLERFPYCCGLDRINAAPQLDVQ